MTIEDMWINKSQSRTRVIILRMKALINNKFDLCLKYNSISSLPDKIKMAGLFAHQNKKNKVTQKQSL